MKAPAPRRKGANRKVDITPELLQALSLGEIETATLTMPPRAHGYAPPVP